MSDKSDTIKKGRLGREGHKKAFLEVLCASDCLGNVMVAARKTGIARQTLYRWRKEDSDFAAEWDEYKATADDMLVDEAHSALIGAIRAGNVTAIIFTLKTLRPEKWGEVHRKNDNEGIEDTHTLSPEFRESLKNFYEKRNDNDGTVRVSKTDKTLYPV